MRLNIHIVCYIKSSLIVLVKILQLKIPTMHEKKLFVLISNNKYRIKVYTKLSLCAVYNIICRQFSVSYNNNICVCLVVIKVMIGVYSLFWFLCDWL